MNEYEKCCAETDKHIRKVNELAGILVRRIVDQTNIHDESKLCVPEINYFAEYTHKLAATTYGSAEYNEVLATIKPALDHHYANNRHHPEHFPNGVSGMNLADLVEMLCDWKASAGRHLDGNILKSIDINSKRFNLSEDLVSILRNTAELLEL